MTTSLSAFSHSIFKKVVPSAVLANVYTANQAEQGFPGTELGPWVLYLYLNAWHSDSSTPYVSLIYVP